MYWYIKKYGYMATWLNGHKTLAIQPSDHITIALFSGWLSILVTNFFGFSVVIVQIFFFLFPAIVFSLCGIKNFRSAPILLKNRSRTILQCVTGIGTLIILTGLMNMWRADVAYALGYRANRYGNYQEAEKLLNRATALNGAVPLYHDELGTTLANLAVAAINEKQATPAADLARQSIEESDRALSISPRNVTFWKSRTKIFYGFTDFDPAFIKQALDAMNVAYTLSPQDPKIAYNLAVLYGQNGQGDKAEELFSAAKTLKPNYRDAYWGLYIVYTEGNKKDEARAILNQYLDSVDATDKEFLERSK